METSGMKKLELRRTLAKAQLEKERKGRKNLGRYLELIAILGALEGRAALAAGEHLNLPSISAKIGPEGDSPATQRAVLGGACSQEAP